MTNQLPPPLPPAPAADPAPRSTSRRLLAAGVGAGLLAGGAIGFAVGVPNLTSAATPTVVDETVQQTDDTDTDTDTDDTDTDTDDTDTDDTGTDDTDTDTDDEQMEVGRSATGEGLRERLQPLVDDGTIDTGQADAVSEFLAEEWNDRPVRRRGPGHRARPVLEGVDTTVEVLGIDVDTLRDELRSGSSLAEIAEANGVDPQTLIDALVAEAEAMLDQAVADGRIDEDRADDRREDLEERVTARVNGEGPERSGRFGAGQFGAGADDET